ncbi:hypothetical protein M406DRAFT_250138 [Cryphonectria parasitica EP155]|uniref:F-box domain-containing protein n=1 Tax=Cryphonectria parasitica (strain ATCC 38755 / EP155) TaxID=660469 RepID=A0A9P4Y9K6_CRYP1|nr:uncharacterized protein M406DRAFT_250138 [Cryphonectria parasitica EP155]KAF3768970.1 hypothetical protein M406DRAFT_250138 [Cryphonectria parasitica EP155]
MEIIDLPNDLFLLITAHLSARTLILCRRVSQRWHAAFTDQALNLHLLKWHFPRCRELRKAYVARGGELPTTATGGLLEANQAQGCRRCRGPPSPDWTGTFALVASRYHHLRTATARSIEKIRLGSTTGPDYNRDVFYPVAPWDRYLRLDNKTAPFHYPDPSWCYGQDEDGDDDDEDGGAAAVLVYRIHPADVVDEVREHIYPWRLLDLDTSEAVEIPFPCDQDRIVRRVRLAEGVLVFEWCERLPYHQLNDREECHRHYVSAFDIKRTRRRHNDDDDDHHHHHHLLLLLQWDITPRADFKLHFLGLPLNTHDRFLSAHTATHYAVYVWQPNRSPWGEDDPIESVVVWDMSSSSTEAKVVRRMTWSALAFYGVRQRSAPRLSGLGLDGRNLYFVEEEHRWAQGAHSSLSAPRVHLVRSTGVPVIPGPRSVDGPAAAAEEEEGRGEQEEQVVQGPAWLDQCGANGDVNLSFCSRLHAAASPDAITSPGIWNGSIPSSLSSVHHHQQQHHRRRHMPTTLSQELESSLRTSPTRWSGWAPCWRHEEFPYLTVSEAVDFRAGVRITARHCFMLETLSVHVRPLLSVRGGNSGGGGEGSSNRKAGRQERRDGDGEGIEEVQFADEMWDELLGKGFICGDERWLVGEDMQGQITIVRF